MSHGRDRFLEALRGGGDLPESLFDGFLPRRLSGLSSVHWTPLEVAVRVAHLLNPKAGEQVLDVGAGVGKVCIVGALLTPGRWVGVDHSDECISAAEEIAETLGAYRASFLRRDAFSIDWTGYSALYFFNPFGESDLMEDRARYDRFVRATYQKLETMPGGTRVAVYFDIGTELPPDYDLVHSEELRGHILTLWTRR